MIFIIFEGFFRALIGIAVFTAIHAGIVCANVAAFNAVAALPHSFML